MYKFKNNNIINIYNLNEKDKCGDKMKGILAYNNKQLLFDVPLYEKLTVDITEIKKESRNLQHWNPRKELVTQSILFFYIFIMYTY